MGQRQSDRQISMEMLSNFLSYHCYYFDSQDPSGAPLCTNTLRVFTTRPETVFGVTFIAIAAEHDLALEGYESLECTSAYTALVSW